MRYAEVRKIFDGSDRNIRNTLINVEGNLLDTAFGLAKFDVFHLGPLNVDRCSRERQPGDAV
jgi:hypothetical protein